uniref:Group XV phospholipase A2 n=1 Tax=Panagrellus redivivus TaxID=6233 RepID=A0A7E4V9W5_PANRE
MLSRVVLFACLLLPAINVNAYGVLNGLPPPEEVPLKRYIRKPGDPKAPSNPIVLVPGDGGTRLDANLTGKPDIVHYTCSRSTKDYFDLWLNLESFVPVAIDCWVDNMRLEFNTTLQRSDNSPGVDVRVPDFGTTDSVEWLDPSKASQGNYFAYIADTLVQWGYKKNKNLVAAGFDWRRSPLELDDFYVALKSLIQRTYYYNHETPVVVIGHSMGNPIMNYFYHHYVDAAWKAQFLASHVSIAGAWGGSMQIIKLFASGYNMDYYRIILPPSRLRAMQRSFTSSAFLFPHRGVWNENDAFAFTATRNYSVSNVEQFFKDVDYPLGIDQYKLASQALIIDAPGIPVHCIYGTDVQTPETFTWAKGYFPDYQPTTVYGDGDGTVNIKSLRVCNEWAEKEPKVSKYL